MKLQIEQPCLKIKVPKVWYWISSIGTHTHTDTKKKKEGCINLNILFPPGTVLIKSLKITCKMSTKAPTRKIFRYKKDFIRAEIISSTNINTMPQKAYQMWVTKLCKQVQPKFKISNWIFLWQRHTPNSN